MSDDGPLTLEDLDHHSPEFARDHLAIFRHARSFCPVLRSKAHGGFFVLTRYADVRRALRDSPALSTGRFVDEAGVLQGGVAVPPNGMRIGIIEMDLCQRGRLCARSSSRGSAFGPSRTESRGSRSWRAGWSMA